MPDPYWNALAAKAAVGSAIGTWIYVTLVAITLGFVIVQARELKRSRRLAAILPTLLARHQDPAAMADREYLYAAYASEPGQFEASRLADTLLRDEKLLESCRRTWLQLYELGRFVRQGHIDRRFVVDWLHVVPIKLWIILGAYVEREMERRHQPEYGMPFALLTYLALQHWFSSPEGGSVDADIVMLHSSDVSKDRQISKATLKDLLDKLDEMLRNGRWLTWWTPPPSSYWLISTQLDSRPRS